MFRNVTEQRAIVREVTFRASHDLLTGLSNRAEFERRLAECLASPDRQKSYLVFIDLDHFKQVNDALGHEGGDALLRDVSTALRDAAGPDALVARWGGDEFVVLVCLPDAEGALAFGKSLLDAITTCGAPPRGAVSASLGIAWLNHSGHDIDEHLKRADYAAYTAKAAGRAQVHLWMARDVTCLALMQQGALRMHEAV